MYDLRRFMCSCKYHFKVNLKFFRCKCGHCSDENLNGAMEFRCCRKVVDTIGNMVFDGSIEHIKCIQ